MIQSVSRAIAILGCIAKNNNQLGLTEISKILGLNKATAYGLLNTLEQYQFVFLSPVSKKYRLGIRLAELGLQVESSFDVRREAKPFVDYLANKYPCSAQVGIEVGGEVIYLLVSASSEYALPAVCYVGLRAPCYCTGIGKAMIAYWSRPRLDAYLSTHPLLPRTSRSITSKSVLLEELAVSRAEGLSVDNEENQLGVVSFGGPIFNLERDVVAAISVGILSAKLTESMKSDMMADIKLCAQELSRQMGYTGKEFPPACPM